MYVLDDDMRSFPGVWLEADAVCPTEGCNNYAQVHDVLIYIAPGSEALCICGECNANNTLSNIVQLS